MNEAGSRDQPSQRRVHPVVTASYYPRVLTWAFAGAMYASAVHARFPALAWGLVAFGLVWPQAVHLIALHSRDTRRAGFAMLSADTILFGACVGATALSPVPAVTTTGFVGTTLLTMGGPGMLVRNLPLYVLSVGVGLYFAGFDPQLRPEPLTFALAAAVLIVYTWSLGYFVNDTGRKAIAVRHDLADTNRRVAEQAAQLASAVAEISSLNNIARAANATLDLDEITRVVMQGLRHVLDFDQMGIGLVDESTGRLVLSREAGSGMTAVVRERLLGMSVPLDEEGSVFGWAIAQQKSVYLPDINEAGVARMSASDRAIYAVSPTRSLLVCPLVVSDRALGVISFSNSDRRFDLEPENIETVERHVVPLASAIRNARLFEEARQARQAALEANETKSSFLANMSHELRTPMNAIIGYSEMLQEDAEDRGCADMVPDLEKIRSAGRHLLELINEVLDLSKIEARKMEIFPEIISVSTLVRDVVGTIEPLVAQNENTLAVGSLDALGEMHTDVTKLRQALFNLLSNAAKFTHGGRISLDVSRVHRGGTDWICFAVADSGIGMTGEELERIFKPFMQADASTTRKFGGTGLGLVITRHFCELMGGGVEVTSEIGRGSTFTIRLPAVLPERPPGDDLPGAGAAPEGPASIVTALVIDDDRQARELIARLLEKAGVRTVGARSGAEGLQFARELQPDLVTLDVIMPGDDGWAVLSELKSDPQLAHIPVVIVTVVDEPQRAYALGAADYVTKPVSRQRLLQTLQRFGLTRSGTVLLVEADPDQQRLMRELLEREGLSVTIAADGRAALESLAGAAPDLILLDLYMPDMDGFEFVRRRAQSQVAADVPMVVITSKSLSRGEIGQLEAGATAVLCRSPDDRDELLSAVRRILGARRQPAAGADA
ncbi:MAG TPA: response regulator [Gammaproteobacteria bacterium]|nr:response regulator [Gammaproteobacteria bacterium]